MRRIGFIGDCFISSRIEVPESVPEWVVLNWEHSYPSKSEFATSKILLGLEKEYYLESFGARKVLAGLANNHTLDYGLSGVLGAVKQIEDNGWEPCGVLLNGHKDHVHRLDLEGRSIALIFYVHESSSPITNMGGKELLPTYNKARASSEISSLSIEVDYLIVVIHWGAEEVALPSPDIVADAHHMVDCGADLIIGHHAHVRQPVEKYKGKLIFYGLGNFYFPDFSTKKFNNGKASSFSKKQSVRNTKSLMVVLDLQDMSVSCLRLRADLINKKVLVEGLGCDELRNSRAWAYRHRFKLSYIYGKVLTKFNTLLREKRLPKRTSVQNLFRLLKSNDYR